MFHDRMRSLSTIHCLSTVSYLLLSVRKCWYVSSIYPETKKGCSVIFNHRYNRNQVRVDQASFLGALGGAGGSLLLGGLAVSGAVVGLVGGTVAMGLYNTFAAERHM